MRAIQFLPATAAALGLWVAAAPAQAQMDPGTQRLIEQLRPQDPDALNATRGLRRPTQVPNEATAPPVTLTPATPASGVQTPMQAAPRTAPTQIAPTQVAPTQIAPSQAARPTTTAPAGMPAASLTVNFASGSDVLTPSAMRELDRLGRALTSQDLAPFRFRIEGHTDTVGPASLNQTLSERRAAAVGRYLETRFGVPAARLDTIGLGETQLVVPTPDETANAENRRVQVINLGR